MLSENIIFSILKSIKQKTALKETLKVPNHV